MVPGRRELLASAGGWILAMHLPGLTGAEPVSADDSIAKKSPARFPHIRLQTHRLEAMRAFYMDKLGLPVASETKDSFAVRAGDTLLEFARAEDGSKPFYHFAFNIPENKLAKAKEWLKKRCTLLLDEDGRDELHFASWTADAVYFHDPSNNIVELIARHTLKNAASGAFGAEELLCVSEIGVVAPDVEKISSTLCRALGVNRYLGSSMFVGDEQGLFVVVPRERLWIPEKKQAATAYATQVMVAGKPGGPVKLDGLPFEIV